MIGIIINVVKHDYLRRGRGLKNKNHNSIRNNLSVLGLTMYRPIMASRARITLTKFLTFYLYLKRDFDLLLAKCKKCTKCIITFQEKWRFIRNLRKMMAVERERKVFDELMRNYLMEVSKQKEKEIKLKMKQLFKKK